MRASLAARRRRRVSAARAGTRAVVAFTWVEHTSELELAIDAGSEHEAWADAVAALAELLDDDAAADGAERRAVEVEAADRARRLAELLAELAFLAETERFLVTGLEALEADGERLHATVRGRTGDAPHLVKAVTLHRLAFAPDGDRWRATVVMDV
jgi:SHS2 domain-containing protein